MMSPAANHLLSVTSRVLAAVVGGYALTSLLNIALPLVLAKAGVSMAQTLLSITMASFLVWAAIIMGTFHARSAVRAWIWLMGGGSPVRADCRSAASSNGSMMTLAAFVLTVAGFAALALSMLKHHRDLIGGALSARRRLGYRIAGWALLSTSLVLVLISEGASIGIALWFGLATMAALIVALLLTYRDSWWRS